MPSRALMTVALRRRVVTFEYNWQSPVMQCFPTLQEKLLEDPECSLVVGYEQPPNV